MKTETPSFEEFLQSKMADKAADRECIIEQFELGIKNGYSWMIECFDIAPCHEYERSVSYKFCHTRIEAEKIWKEEHKKAFYDNAIFAYDLNQVINDEVELVVDTWFEDEEDDFPYDEPVVPPAEIYFAAEAGGAYAWNESCAITIHHYFEDHPRVNEIKQIDKEFGIWSWWHSDYYEKDDFPWDASEAKEKELAGKLAEILADTDVKIIF